MKLLANVGVVAIHPPRTHPFCSLTPPEAHAIKSPVFSVRTSRHLLRPALLGASEILRRVEVCNAVIAAPSGRGAQVPRVRTVRFRSEAGPGTLAYHHLRSSQQEC